MMKRLLIVLACACSGRSAPAQTPALEQAPPRQAPAIEAGPSIYELPVRLVDANGAEHGLDVARGTPVLVAMFYASCSIACPLLISEVQQVLAELPADERRDVRVLLVSFDAARDTPAKLRALAQERKLDAQWILTAANDVDARALAAVLGVKYRKLANGEFAHGSTIVALDGEGREIARTDALGQRDSIVRAIAADQLLGQGR